MNRNVEARLAKLEASTGAGSGVPDFIFAQNEEGETLDEFDKRVERLRREAVERDGCEPVVFKMILNHGTSHGGRVFRAKDADVELPRSSSG